MQRQTRTANENTHLLETRRKPARKDCAEARAAFRNRGHALSGKYSGKPPQRAWPSQAYFGPAHVFRHSAHAAGAGCSAAADHPAVSSCRRPRADAAQESGGRDCACRFGGASESAPRGYLPATGHAGCHALDVLLGRRQAAIPDADLYPGGNGVRARSGHPSFYGEGVPEPSAPFQTARHEHNAYALAFAASSAPLR